MTIGGTGLGDNQRMFIGVIFSGLLAINVSLAGLAAANQIVVPGYVYLALGLAAVVIYAIKDQLGIKDATSAAIAKVVDKDSTNNRDISKSVEE
jgi:hypothetical protein